MNLHLTNPRASTLLLCGLLLALLVSTPVPLAVVVALIVWALHTPVALLVGVVLTLGWRILHPKAVH
jgi:hypothetical protein